MGHTLSRFFFVTVSAIFHPLIYPTLAALLLFTTDSYFMMFEYGAKFYVIGLIFIMTYLAPLLLMPVFSFLGVIKGLTLDNRRERTAPLLVTGVLYYFAYFFLKKYQAIVFLNVFILASALAILLAIFISFRWKISLHMIGAGGFAAFLVQQTLIYQIDNFPIFVAVLILGGLVGTARLALQSHSPNQIFAGFLTGFLMVFGVTQFVF